MPASIHKAELPLGGHATHALNGLQEHGHGSHAHSGTLTDLAERTAGLWSYGAPVEVKAMAGRAALASAAGEMTG